jgi:uncharacterized protein
VNGLLDYIVKALVDEPSGVSITEIVSGDTTTYEVHTAPGDMGKVIGRHGRNAQALRLVAKAVAGKDQRRVFVELID